MPNMNLVPNIIYVPIRTAEHLKVMEIRESVFISVEEKDETTKRSKKITIHVITFT